MLLKFIPVEKDGDVLFAHPAQTLPELIKSGKEYAEYLQYQGFNDKSGREVYQGDLLELKITDELMDFPKDGFANSNLGKDLKKHPKVISVLCHIGYDGVSRIGCSYDVYYMDRDRRIVNNDGEPEVYPIASGTDTNFPMYLCQKGATVIANSVTTTCSNLFEQIGSYTGYTRTTPIPEHAVMNAY